MRMDVCLRLDREVGEARTEQPAPGKTTVKTRGRHDLLTDCKYDTVQYSTERPRAAVHNPHAMMSKGTADSQHNMEGAIDARVLLAGGADAEWESAAGMGVSKTTTTD